MEVSNLDKDKLEQKKCTLFVTIFLVLFFSLVNNMVTAQSAWYFSPSDVNILHSTAADYRIAYGKGVLQFADLRLPKTTGVHPVAIIVHGGCWVSMFADLQNTTALADALRKAGFATWNIEYRREDNEGGGWPGTFIDVANATDYLRTISKEYSLDLNNVIVIGHSAGGHLALWLAGRSRLPKTSPLYIENPLPLRGVISLGGVPDLETFRKPGEDACGTDVVGKLLGANEEQISQHYKDASPIELLPIKVPQILIYGADDEVVPQKLSDAYVKKAKTMNDKVQVISVNHAAHHEYNVPNSVTWPAIISAALALVNPAK